MNSILLITGIWRAILSLPGADLPFTFELNDNHQHYTMDIINGTERIHVDEISLSGDSVFIRLPLFDSEIRAHVAGGEMQGNFINHVRKTNQRIPFTAKAGQSFRFNNGGITPSVNVTGRWETDFSPGTADSSKAIGVFEQLEHGIVHGTFLTPSGDYRYLDGCVKGDSLLLSCFDGAHAFLFEAKIAGKRMSGIYRSGNHWQEPFSAIRNEQAALPDPYSITWLKEGYKQVDFSLPDLDGQHVSPLDSRFRNKVLLVEVMGSWCPNCMDESAFLAKAYEQYKSQGLEIIGLAFEKTADFNQAVANVTRLKTRYHISYPLVIANKDSVTSTLPMLNKISGYPTTIFIDKKGKVRKIYTGFSGPATGNEYMKFQGDFHRLVQMLLME